MNAESKKLQEYEKSDTFKEHSDAGTLGTLPPANEFLRNRLRAAFLAGVEAGKDIAAERLVRVAKY